VGATARRADLVPPGISPAVLMGRNPAARLLWRLPTKMRHLRPRVAHFQYIVPPAYRGRAVVTVHDLSYELLPELEDRVDGWALRRLVPPSVRRAAKVFTVSEWTKADLVRRYQIDPERVVVTPNGVDPRFRPEGETPDLEPYVLFVGALRARKDPVTALEAMARLPSDLHLMMVGPPKGEERHVEATVERLGLGTRVHVLGHVSQRALAALYRGAQCLMLPSRYEGFALPVVEAMASGTPVVSTTVGAIPEIAGDAAVLVPPRDPVALAEAVVLAMKERCDLVTRGLERAREFTWEALARSTAAVYRELVER
jgi:glycosyltransferase involved in cell wall biosynthesis